MTDSITPQTKARRMSWFLWRSMDVAAIAVIIAIVCFAVCSAYLVLKVVFAGEPSTSIAAWVQAIGVPFAVIATYLAATIQVSGMNRQRSRDRDHEQAVHLAYLHELIQWLATSIGHTMRRYEGGRVKAETPVHLSLVTENIALLRRIDFANFALVGLATDALSARAITAVVADYYESGDKKKYSTHSFQHTLRVLALTGASVGDQLRKMAESGAIAPVKYQPATEWNLAGDWHAYFQPITAELPPYTLPPDEEAVATTSGSGA